jgi:flagellar protein FliS
MLTTVKERIFMAVMNPYNYKKPIGGQPLQAVNSDISEQNVSVSQRTKTDSYMEQKIMNARPEELTLMLYEGVVKFINQTALFNDQKTYDKSNNANLRAQAILQELRSTLNMEIEMSENLENLYIYMMEQLVDANITKSNETLQDVLNLATDLRDTWKEAMGL